MTHAFLKAWRSWEPNNSPYLLPGDEALQPLIEKDMAACYRSPEEYINSERFLDRNDTAMHLGLHPMPMFGNLLHAKVVFLLLNPGLKPGNYFAEKGRGEYWAALRRSTQQKLSGAKYPFLFLDPAFSWHSGFLWWYKKLSSFVNRARIRMNGSPADGLCEISKQVANIELYPYHSRKFKLGKRIREGLHSRNLAISFVHDVLLPKARSGDTLLVVMRGAKEWALPNEPGVLRFSGGEARGAHLSEGTRVGRKIRKYLGLA